MNHSSQVSEIKIKTSNLKVTLESVFHILRSVFRTKNVVCLQMYGYAVHIDIVEKLIYLGVFFPSPTPAPAIKENQV